jgi:uncharacterized protein (DUF2236 family)
MTLKHKVEIRERLRRTGIARPGPGSVSWKINREIVVVAGWGRAILLQVAHPLIGAGVDEHSSFRGSLTSGLHRLRSTIGAMLSMTFGDDEEAIAAAAGINTIHDRVSGRLPATAGGFAAGERYSAHDAELLRWVHATLLDSILIAYETLVGPLTAAERDQYCAESVVMEPLLDIPAGLLPRNTVQLDAYVREPRCFRRDGGSSGPRFARCSSSPSACCPRPCGTLTDLHGRRATRGRCRDGSRPCDGCAG